MTYFLCYLMGCIVQTIVDILMEKKRCTYGTLAVDTKSSDTCDHYDVCLGDIDKLPKKKYIKLKIKID